MTFRTTRIVTAAILVGSLAVAPLLDKDESTGLSATNSTGMDPLPIQSPQFQLRWQQHQLALSGHTASLQHERDLLQVAYSSYPEDSVITDFRPLGIVPSYWEAATIQALWLLSQTESAQVALSAGDIKIRALTANKAAWQSRLDNLKKALPPAVLISANVLFVEPVVSVPAMCRQAFSAFHAGPINFEESSAAFRNSALPRLDRVIALAKACRHSKISITGHTDSSGNESWNQRLSLQRANAVGDYFVAGGVARDRLQVSAAGSVAPIADDSTRYGRSVNRRIEITLSNTDPAAELNIASSAVR